MKFFIEQYSDLAETFRQIRGHPYPYFLVKYSGKPNTKSWRDLNAFFHVSVVGLFMEKTGYTKTEAKNELQKLHAMVAEHKTYYEVESIAGMSYDRLLNFVEACQHTLITQFGVMAESSKEEIDLIKTKTIHK